MPETTASNALMKASYDFFQLRALAIAAETLLENCDWENDEKILSSMKVIRIISSMAQNMAEAADSAVPLN